MGNAGFVVYTDEHGQVVATFVSFYFFITYFFSRGRACAAPSPMLLCSVLSPLAMLFATLQELIVDCCCSCWTPSRSAKILVEADRVRGSSVLKSTWMQVGARLLSLLLRMVLE